MRASVTRTALTVVFMALAVGAGVASAQDPGPATVPGGIAQAVRRVDIRPDSVSSPRGGRRGTWIGALVGAGAAATGTYFFAKNYGENETGGFCAGCFLAWGAYAIPAGALVGAVVGNLVSRTSAPQSKPRVPHTFVTPVVGRRGGAVVLSVRY